jgi:hypothetical protein
MSATTTPVNPLLADPAIAIARERLARNGIGQWLAVYAVARAKAPLPDPLTALGLPLLDLLLQTIPEQPIAVTALRTATATGFEHWSLILAFASGLRASVDIGAGIGPGQTNELDLRVEWSGADRVVLVEPMNVAVTVTTASGISTRSAEITPILDALGPFIWDLTDPHWQPAAALITAALRSFESNAPVSQRS